MSISPIKQCEVRISVALVTRNRPESLGRCLKSLRAQSVQPFEIVVSDDSDEIYVPEIQELAKRHGCIYTRGPCRGLYANRNHASLACRGTHILTADDDHTHPQNYIENILKVVATDQNRVWIFAERWPGYPATPLICPPELSRSGHGRMPKDPSNCAAIADGATIYPRQIFEQGLRYDETYSFGPMWYLWGKFLKKKGWRISFSNETFIWHHGITEDRLSDFRAFQKQLEGTTYAQFVNALWIEPSITSLTWAIVYLLRRLVIKDSIVWFKVKSRLHIYSAYGAITNTWRVRKKYVSHQHEQKR